MDALLELGDHPRVLYLADDGDIVRRQLSGERIVREEAGELRNDVSTDEISPVAILSYYDDRLARYPYTGFTCGGGGQVGLGDGPEKSGRAGGATPIGPGDVQAAGFSVVVAGRRYGKGSSREHSPAAERLAGIRLVVAESFERIYRQNADNTGLFTSTDFSLLDRVERGEAIPIEALLVGREPLAAAILRAGGLLAFGQQHLRDAAPVVVTCDSIASGDSDSDSNSKSAPLTLYGKIVRRHLLRTPVSAGVPAVGDGTFIRADRRFIHEYYTGMAAHMLDHTLGRDHSLRDPESIVVFEDHATYVDESPAHIRSGLVPNMHSMVRAQRDFVDRHRLRCHRTLTDAEAAEDARAGGRNVAGISHAMIAELYALPGQVVAGTDSHTPHSGALGCFAFGVGTTDMANAFVTGAVRMTMAPVLRVELEGVLASGIAAKDVVLHLLALPSIRDGGGVGQVFEFGGPVVRAMSTDERATLTNMTAEMGGLTGIVEPDEETVRFIEERRNVRCAIEEWMRSDAGAAYSQVLRINCGQVSAMVARPGDPGNGLPVDALSESIAIDIAYGGSCTAGKREDFDCYHEVLAWGIEHGWTVPEKVSMFLQYGTTAVRDYCIARGYDKVFERAGARILQPSCGACANCGPGSSTERSQVTISAINRNFPGRSGPGQVWLASPATVMASALAGRICSFDELKRMSTATGTR